MCTQAADAAATGDDVATEEEDTDTESVPAVEVEVAAVEVEVLPENEVDDILLLLHSIPLKLAAVLYTLTDGHANVGVDRDSLVKLLEPMGVNDPPNATQSNRVEGYKVNWFGHNAGRGSKARLWLTPQGVKIIKGIHTHATGEVQQESIDLMVSAIKKLGQPPLPVRESGQLATIAAASAQPASAKKPVSPATPMTTPQEPLKEPVVSSRKPQENLKEPVVSSRIASEAEQETEQETEVGEEDHTSPGALQARLEAVLERFEDEVDADMVADAVGKEVADFFKQNRCLPTTEQSDDLLKKVKRWLMDDHTLGSGKVTYSEVSNMMMRVTEAAQLPELVTALEERAGMP